MARNEEKQQGRLNRLWLQREREEGRLKDVRERRPKLSTLNSASSVKKWIPSINKDIEYYLQQSQLSHYPERKIAEFQQHIEALEKEYKRFITKLRVLDPSCKHKPWTPRAYCKRRADLQDSANNEKISRLSDSRDDSVQRAGRERNFVTSGSRKVPSSETSLSFSEARSQTHHRTDSLCEPSLGVLAVQDQPLSFDRTRLAVAAAAFRSPSGQPGSSQSQNLARLLQSGLPNLSNVLKGRAMRSGDTENDDVRAERHDCEVTEGRAGHVLGLDCYSSSDDDCDT